MCAAKPLTFKLRPPPEFSARFLMWVKDTIKKERTESAFTKDGLEVLAGARMFCSQAHLHPKCFTEKCFIVPHRFTFCVCAFHEYKQAGDAKLFLTCPVRKSIITLITPPGGVNGRNADREGWPLAGSLRRIQPLKSPGVLPKKSPGNQLGK